METEDGDSCKSWDGEPYPLQIYGEDYFTNTPNLKIPIRVEAENTIVGCSIAKGSKGVDCEAGTVHDNYDKEYLCRTWDESGSILSEGRNSGVVITCALENGETEDTSPLPDIVVDTKPPVTTYLGISRGFPKISHPPQVLHANFVVNDSNGQANDANYSHAVLMRSSVTSSNCPNSGSSLNYESEPKELQPSNTPNPNYGVLGQFDYDPAKQETFVSDNFHEEDFGDDYYHVCYSAVDLVGNEEDVQSQDEFNSALGCMTLDYADCSDNPKCDYFFYGMDNIDANFDQVCKGAQAAEVGVLLGGVGSIVIGVGGGAITAAFAPDTHTYSSKADAPSNLDFVAEGCYSKLDWFNSGIGSSWMYLNEQECAASQIDGDERGYMHDQKEKCCEGGMVHTNAKYSFGGDWKSGTKECDVKFDYSKNNNIGWC